MAEKENLHARNLHRERYNFELLCKASPALGAFVAKNQYQDQSVDFSDPAAVKALNKALLKYFYSIDGWDIPAGYLCPPIPGRADYLHYIADLLSESNGGQIPAGDQVNVLDIGVGANCVYPLIGSSVYGWRFVGADTDPIAVHSAEKILSLNKRLQQKIEIRHQANAGNIFGSIIKPGEFFDLTMCNPPFHASLKEAELAAGTKQKNLGIVKTPLNFGGQKNELWYPGGEAAFISRMIEQSTLIPDSCFWFTTLVSKKDSLAGIYKALKKAEASNNKTISMAQGQKKSRIVAWTFLTPGEQSLWKDRRWQK
ncbi:MAG: 23S rRNA (adenine(1618)-N(6))-methyltransferase RlmF [Mucilaginibacter sp.]